MGGTLVRCYWDDLGGFVLVVAIGTDLELRKGSRYRLNEL